MSETVAGGHHTTKEYTRQAAARVAAKKQAAEAAAWCVENEKREFAAANSGLFPLASRGKIRSALKALQTKSVKVRDHHKQVMTNTERMEVARWALLSADGQKPKDRVMVSSKIKMVLRARHKSNKARKYGPGTLRLNSSELDTLKSVGVRACVCVSEPAVGVVEALPRLWAQEGPL